MRERVARLIGVPQLFNLAADILPHRIQVTMNRVVVVRHHRQQMRRKVTAPLVATIESVQ